MTTAHQANLLKRTSVDYRVKTSVPIRDMWSGGMIYCLVDVYGLTDKDLGAVPMLAAIKRLGLDPIRYQAMIWDLTP